MEPLKCHASSQLPVYAVRVCLGALLVTALVLTILSGLQVIPRGTYAFWATLLVGFAVLGVYHASHQPKKEEPPPPEQDICVPIEAPSPPVSLTMLSNDCLEGVLEHLSPMDLAHFNGVSRRFHSLVQGREKWMDRLVKGKLQAKAFQLWKETKELCLGTYSQLVKWLAQVYAKEMVAELEKRLDAIETVQEDAHLQNALRDICETVISIESDATDQIIEHLCQLVHKELFLREEDYLLRLFYTYPTHPSLIASASGNEKAGVWLQFTKALPHHPQEALRILKEVPYVEASHFFSLFVKTCVTQDRSFMNAVFQDLEEYARKSPHNKEARKTQPIHHLPELAKVAIHFKKYDKIIGWLRELPTNCRIGLWAQLLNAPDFVSSQEDLESLWSELTVTERSMESICLGFAKKMSSPEQMLRVSQTDETKAAVALRKLPGDPEAAEALLKQIQDPLLQIQVLAQLATTFKESQPQKSSDFFASAYHLFWQLPAKNMEGVDCLQQPVGLTYLIKARLLNEEDRERHLARVVQRLGKSKDQMIINAIGGAYKACGVDRAFAYAMEYDGAVPSRISLLFQLSHLDE